jgi:hypothetical protein
MRTDHDSLHDALVDLATTMSPNPDRLGQVRRRVARRRHRRMAAGAAVSVGAVAGAVGIAMVPRDPRTPLLFNVAGPSLPACASVSAPPAPQKTTAPEGSTPAEPDAVARYKGYAVITELGAGTLTLGELATPGLLPPSDSIVVIVDAATTFENHGRPAAATDTAIGQRVLFSVSVGADQREHLDYLDLGPDAVDVAPGDAAAEKAADDAQKKAAANNTDQATDDLKAANEPVTTQAAPANDGVVRGKGWADAAPVNNEWVLTAYIEGAAGLQSVRLVLGPDTQYFRFEAACTNAELVLGSSVVFSAVANGDGTYNATELRVYQ